VDARSLQGVSNGSQKRRAKIQGAQDSEKEDLKSQSAQDSEEKNFKN
jgi:hypothetical protein